MIGCLLSKVANEHDLKCVFVLSITTWYAHCRHVKSHHAAVLMNLCVCLIIANVIFVVGVHRTEDEVSQS